MNKKDFLKKIDEKWKDKIVYQKEAGRMMAFFKIEDFEGLIVQVATHGPNAMQRATDFLYKMTWRCIERLMKQEEEFGARMMRNKDIRMLEQIREMLK